MKAVIIQARESYKPGDTIDVTPAEFAVLASEGVAVTKSEWDAKESLRASEERAREEGKNRIISACERAVTRGAVLAKGDADGSREKVQAKFVGRYERGECSADIAVEAIESLPTVQASEPGRRTSSTSDLGNRVEAGEVSGNDLVKATIQAMEPFSKTMRTGGIVQNARRQGGNALLEAMHASKEKARLLARLDREMQGGFVVRAATYNYVDPAGSNPLGLLNTELMVLNNLGHLENQLAMIRDITTNIAGQPVAFNQYVRTRYFNIPKVQLKTSTNAWSTNQTGSNTDVSVRLDQYAGVPISFENTMLSSTPRSLFREQYDPQLYSLGEYVLYKLINTIFAGATRIGNDDDSTSTVRFQDSADRVFNAAGATLKTFVSDLPAKLDLLKMPGGDEPPGASDLMRYAWVHTRPYAAATGDTNFVLNQSIQSIRGSSSNGNVMETGLFERLGNLKFRKSQLMADGIAITGSGADATTNGISVTAPDYDASTYVGFAGTRAALLFATRVPEDYTQVLPNVPSTAAIETVTSPQLGITFLMVKYLDHAYEIANARIQLMFGFGIGDERQGCLITK